MQTTFQLLERWVFNVQVFMHTLLVVVLRCREFFAQFLCFQLFCSILKKTTNMACQALQDLDLYLIVEKKEMKPIDAKYQVQVGYWAIRNHLQDYKIYVMVICMFDEGFLNKLLQFLRNSPWPTHPTNQNYKF